MNNDERKFERVARYLDGEDVSLSAEEADLARGIREDEAAVGPALEAALPERSRVRVLAGVLADADRHASRRRTVIRFAAPMAAAAAAVIAVAVWHNATDDPAPEPGPVVSVADQQPENELLDLARQSGQSPLEVIDALAGDADQDPERSLIDDIDAWYEAQLWLAYQDE